MPCIAHPVEMCSFPFLCFQYTSPAMMANRRDSPKEGKMIPRATAVTEMEGASVSLSGGNCTKEAHAALWLQAEYTARRVWSMFTRAVSVGC